MLYLTALLSLSVAKAQEDCLYRLGGIELDLRAFKGHVLGYTEQDLSWTYSICSNQLPCDRESETTYGMVETHKDGINECHQTAVFEQDVQPFYDFTVASWIFNYSNGDACPDQNQQTNLTTTIAFNCNPLAEQPLLVDVFVIDSCNALFQVEWEGACIPPPPPNERCEFKSGLFGGQTLNLSSLQGSELSFVDENSLSWEFTPCANALNCSTSHGYELPVMSRIGDPTGDCVKFLGVWGGDAIPFYDYTVFGQDYWDFFWADGEECVAGGPVEVLNVRYYCNPQVDGARITKAGGVGPCQFRIEIDTNLACANSSELVETEKTVQKLHSDMREVFAKDQQEKDLRQKKFAIL